MQCQVLKLSAPPSKLTRVLQFTLLRHYFIHRVENKIKGGSKVNMCVIVSDIMKWVCMCVFECLCLSAGLPGVCQQHLELGSRSIRPRAAITTGQRWILCVRVCEGEIGKERERVIGGEKKEPVVLPQEIAKKTAWRMIWQQADCGIPCYAFVAQQFPTFYKEQGATRAGWNVCERTADNGRIVLSRRQTAL